MNSLEQYEGKEILITGGLGLIGSTIANKLNVLGAKITILDAKIPIYGGNFFNIENIKKQINVEIGDIRDRDKVNQIVQGKDIIFNLAGQIDYTYSLDEPHYDLDINCRGHLNVLEACRKYNPNAVVLFSGSRMQYGKTEYLPVDEKHPTNPLSIYGVHKLTGEKYHLAYNNHYGLKTVMFRISNPYGPRSQMKHYKYSIINWFIRQAIENKKITVYGDGSQMRDYIYIDDVADAFIQSAINKNAYGEVFNLGSGEGTKFIDMVNTIVETVGSGEVAKVPWPKEWKNVETGDYIGDISKLKNAINWKPKISLKEGIKKTYEFYRENKENYW
ncbi:NAD-dependent epimerase/dehydratase family protein [Candidatus Woesearchaeota archaeon]|nr:NAD-dependent epimerase/dehydratase family protein [Candidatus Woesearchaeota archaeon]